MRRVHYIRYLRLYFHYSYEQVFTIFTSVRMSIMATILYFQRAIIGTRCNPINQFNPSFFYSFPEPRKPSFHQLCSLPFSGFKRLQLAKVSVVVDYIVYHNLLFLGQGVVVYVIAQQLDLQLPVQSVSITTKVVISNPTDGEVYSILHYEINFVSATGRQFSSGTLVSSTNKTDHHDITEILLKVALNTIVPYSFLGPWVVEQLRSLPPNYKSNTNDLGWWSNAKTPNRRQELNRSVR